MRCSEVREALPAYVRDGDKPLPVRRHVSRCTQCRAELARYDALLDGLGSLALHPAEPPRGLVDSLVAIPRTAGRMASLVGHVSSNRARYAGGAAVALMGIAGTALWRSRARRLAAA